MTDVERELADTELALQAAQVNQRRSERQAGLHEQTVAELEQRRSALAAELAPEAVPDPTPPPATPPRARSVISRELAAADAHLQAARFAESCQGGRNGTRAKAAAWQEFHDTLRDELEALRND